MKLDKAGLKVKKIDPEFFLLVLLTPSNLRMAFIALFR